MNCEQAKLLLNARFDRELDPADRTTLEAHLAVCVECRDHAQAFCTHDAELVRAFQPHRDAAGRLAERVINEMSIENRTPRASTRARQSNWVSLLLATAVGFLTAVTLFQPWKPEQIVLHDSGSRMKHAIVPTSVAHMTIATGNVEFRQPSTGSWKSMKDISTFVCPSDGSVRTGKEVRCELKTADDCIVRMNGDTEVVFRSGRHVQLKRGQIWCLSPENVLLEVDPPDDNAHSILQPLWSCTRSETPPDVDVGVDSGGAVSVKTNEMSCQLKPGETATIDEGRVNVSQPPDPLLFESWMQPLLISKGHTDQELAQRVDRLLAQIGRSKLSTLYEHEIRSLGEFAILPLMRYVQSTQSKKEPHRRLTAMRIVSDLATVWTIGDLVRMLNDDDPTVRFLSANALKRLTGLTQGCPPEKWQTTGPETAKALKKWQQWWESNQEGVPLPFSPKNI
jgi:hypothetical protein